MDLRLKDLPFTFEGRTYKLRCNMNVLADFELRVQDRLKSVKKTK